MPYNGQCFWRAILGDAFPCLPGILDITVYDDSGYKIRVRLGDGDHRIEWIKDYGASKPECHLLTNESIPYSFASGDCDASSSTCQITALALDSACPGHNAICEACLCGLIPDEFDLTVSGFSGDYPICDTLGGIYRLAYLSGCDWYFNSGGNEEWTEVAVWFTIDAGDYLVRAHVFHQIAWECNMSLYWEYNFGTTPPDCTIINSLSVPWKIGSLPNDCCQHDKSPVIITAV